MISERVAEVFSKFNIQKYYTYPVTLYKKEKQLPDKYYLFCCPLLGFEVVDFANSVFYRTQGIHIRHYLQFNSLEEYKAHTGLARVEKLVLNSNFNSSLDLFKARIGGMYVSEALKDALEILEFTGIHILDNYEPELVIEGG